MTNGTGSHHQELQDLVLSYEDLSSEERTTADAHLTGCAECTQLLVAVRAIERAGAALAAPSELGELHHEALDPSLRERADASLAALRVRLGVERAGRARRWPVFLLPAAAVLAAVVVLVLLPRRAPDNLVNSLRIEAPSSLRGSGATEWRTGQAFVLRLDLDRPATPIVVHLGPTGDPQLLFPEPGVRPLPRFPAGAVRLPPSGSNVEWRLEGDPGLETFLVGASTDPGFDLTGLMREIQEAAASGGRADRVEATRAALARRTGTIRSTEIRHAP